MARNANEEGLIMTPILVRVYNNDEWIGDY